MKQTLKKMHNITSLQIKVPVSNYSTCCFIFFRSALQDLRVRDKSTLLVESSGRNFKTSTRSHSRVEILQIANTCLANVS